MIKGFEFKDGMATYTCTVESRKGDTSDAWWWFAVSGDQQRYAPFRAERSDTQASVKERIVAFYENRKFQLTQPTVRGGHWKRRAAPTGQAADASAPQAAPPA